MLFNYLHAWQDVFKLLRIVAVVLFVIYMFTFDEETWEQIEKAQAEAAESA